MDRKTNKYINEKAQFCPLNFSIHRQAENIWQKIELEIGREILDKLELDYNRNYTTRFPSSRQLLGRQIRDIYEGRNLQQRPQLSRIGEKQSRRSPWVPEDHGL